MLIKNIICIVLGIIFGSAVSGGIFSLVNSVKLLPNFADRTHTKHCSEIYETAILLGASFWNLIFFLRPDLTLPYGVIFLGFIGLFMGIFIGCLALSLAEKLSITAIVSRRFRLHKGISFLLLSMALGKLLGNLIYFIMGWYRR